MMRLALMGIALAFSSPRSALAGYVFDDSSIRTAVDAWLSNPAAAEATYGHISTWGTSGVTDMSYLFCAQSCTSSCSSCWCNDCNSAAASFNEDIGAWDTSSVTSMIMMFYEASAFDQDLGWCLGDDVWLGSAFANTPCASTSCGVGNMAALWCDGTMNDITIRTAVTAWFSDRAAAKATYGHIKKWDTSGVTDMSGLFCETSYCGYYNSGASAFNKDIGRWDTSGVTTMKLMFYRPSAFNQDIGNWAVGKVTDMDRMFRGASDFDQDLGWCVGADVSLEKTFGTQIGRTPCESTLCGAAQRDAIGICEWLPFARPCLIGKKNKKCYITSGTLIIAIVLILLAGAGRYVHRRKKEDETYVAAARRLFPDSERRAELLYSCLRFCCRRKKDPIIVNSWPVSTAESPREDPDEYALETRAAALFATKAVAVETVERPGFTRKLSSFLFGEQEEASQRTEPEPSAPKFEEMYNQIAAWYKQPENAALRARWGPFPEPDEFQTWPGFVRVTNAFLDATVLEGEAVTSPASNVVVDAEPVSPGISFWGQFH